MTAEDLVQSDDHTCLHSWPQSFSLLARLPKIRPCGHLLTFSIAHGDVLRLVPAIPCHSFYSPPSRLSWCSDSMEKVVFGGRDVSNRKLTFALCTNYLTGAAGGTIATLVTHPFDAIKVCMA